MQLLSDVKTGRPHRRQLSMSRQILNTDSFRSHASTPQSPDPDTDILSSQHNISRTGSTPMHSQPFASGGAPHRDVSALESLRAELEETKRRMGADLVKAREEALGVMRATGQLPNVVMCAAVGIGTGTGLANIVMCAAVVTKTGTGNGTGAAQYCHVRCCCHWDRDWDRDWGCQMLSRALLLSLGPGLGPGLGLPNVVMCAAVVTGTGIGTGTGSTRARASVQAHVLCQGRRSHPKERGGLDWPLDP